MKLTMSPESSGIKLE